MLTREEIGDVLESQVVPIEDVLYGRLRLEDMGSYFRREKKENLREQGYSLPPELIDPDDDIPPIPFYLKEQPNQDKRTRYSKDYDGGFIRAPIPRGIAKPKARGQRRCRGQAQQRIL